MLLGTSELDDEVELVVGGSVVGGTDEGGDVTVGVSLEVSVGGDG